MERPKVELKTVMLTVDDNLTVELEKLAKEGWQLAADIKPVAIYQLVRAVQSTELELPGRGGITVDESKIQLIRDGRVVQ